ncbi:MAG: hypothetical protein WAK55_09290, partial [Xanthobacteraceae bacterium]
MHERLRLRRHPTDAVTGSDGLRERAAIEHSVCVPIERHEWGWPFRPEKMSPEMSSSIRGTRYRDNRPITFSFFSSGMVHPSGLLKLEENRQAFTLLSSSALFKA